MGDAARARRPPPRLGAGRSRAAAISPTRAPGGRRAPARRNATSSSRSRPPAPLVRARRALLQGPRHRVEAQEHARPAPSACRRRRSSSRAGLDDGVVLERRQEHRARPLTLRPSEATKSARAPSEPLPRCRSLGSNLARHAPSQRRSTSARMRPAAAGPIMPSEGRVMALTFRTATARRSRSPRRRSTRAPSRPARREAARARNFRATRWADSRTSWVAERRGRSRGARLPLPARRHGSAARGVRVGGIASVGVAPEARGRGVGAALLGHLCTESRTRAGRRSRCSTRSVRASTRGTGYATASAYRRLRAASGVDPLAQEAGMRVARRFGRRPAAIAACGSTSPAPHGLARARRARCGSTRFGDERRGGSSRGRPAGGRLRRVVARAERAARADALVVDEIAARTARGRARALERRRAARPGDRGARRRRRRRPDRSRAGRRRRRPLRRRARWSTSLGELAAGPMVNMFTVESGLPARGWAEEGSLVLDFRARAPG